MTGPRLSGTHSNDISTPNTNVVPDRFAGPWFTAKTAAAYIPCKTVRAWYDWRKRHGIVARANGTVAKADLDRELRRTSGRALNGRHPHSLANLQKRRSA